MFVLFQANARVSGLVSISRTLRAKADAGDATKSELEKLQVTHKAPKEANERVQSKYKNLFDELQRKQELAANDVRHQREEIDRLRKELEARPTEKVILEKFRTSPDYYTEVNARRWRRSRFAGTLPPGILQRPS